MEDSKWVSNATFRNSEKIESSSRREYFVSIPSSKYEDRWVEIQNTKKKISAIVPVVTDKKDEKQDNLVTIPSSKLEKALNLDSEKEKSIRMRFLPKPNNEDAIILKDKTQKFVVSNKQ